MHLLLLEGSSDGVTIAATTTEERTTAVSTTTAGTYTLTKQNFNSQVFTKHRTPKDNYLLMHCTKFNRKVRNKIY